ncbi:MAG TPA: cell division protein FtsL [Verrucomicrobiae bacterium]|nr:cell division protein FtsL [Verrucomicrobiae bacterium]
MNRRDIVFTLALAGVVLGSALIVVKTKHENRTLVHQLEQLRLEKARLETEWAQLQLEEATLAHHGRVEQIARDKLGMTEPAETRIVRAP